MHVGPNGVYDMSKYSSCDDLHDGCICIHVRLKYAMFNLVAKLHLVVKLLKLLSLDDLSFS